MHKGCANHTKRTSQALSHIDGEVNLCIYFCKTVKKIQGLCTSLVLVNPIGKLPHRLNMCPNDSCSTTS